MGMGWDACGYEMGCIWVWDGMHVGMRWDACGYGMGCMWVWDGMHVGMGCIAKGLPNRVASANKDITYLSSIYLL